MLETQHYMEGMDHTKKRGRDDEQELNVGTCSFSEHRNVSSRRDAWSQGWKLTMP